MADHNIKVICRFERAIFFPPTKNKNKIYPKKKTKKRFRPVNEIEKNAIASDKRVKFSFPSDDTVSVTVEGKDQNFTVDKVFVEATQADVYNLAAKEMVEDIIGGFNSTIFAFV